jgi:hypothetical protein
MYHYFVISQHNVRVTVIYTTQIITRILQPFWTKFLQPYKHILFNREKDLKLQTKKHAGFHYYYLPVGVTPSVMTWSPSCWMGWKCPDVDKVEIYEF